MMKDIEPNHKVLPYFFYFIQERMNIFWRKCEHKKSVTDDPIFKKYKFTNVYRVTDRVSQYLLRNIIYHDTDSSTQQDVLLRVLLFKVFNKIETWEYIRDEYGEISIKCFDVQKLTAILTQRQRYTPIFNNAYMMTGAHRNYSHIPSKHGRWLEMIKLEIIEAGLLQEMLNASSLKELFEILRGCTFIGDFLAYQYAIDLNYSPFFDFSEDSFVKAGIGAIRGIKKCFICYGDRFEDAIVYVKDNFEELCKIYGFEGFRALPNHPLSLLDLQNCFCETDKYLRAKMPELKVDNIRIKQTYTSSQMPITFYFPPKWDVKLDKQLCIQPNIKELTLF